MTLNGEAHTLEAASSVEALLAKLELAPEKVAVECNGQIIPASLFATHQFLEGDVVEIVHFIGGG